MESSRRDLLNDMAEHEPILRNDQIRGTPVLVSHPKQVQHPITGILFEFCSVLDVRTYVPAPLSTT